MTFPTAPAAALTRRRALAAIGMLPAAVLAGCGFGRSTDRPEGLRLLIPNIPGGGYDHTARTMARILEQNDLTGPIERFNVVGGGGSVALARLMREAGNEKLLAMAGVGVVGAAQVNGSPWRLSDATALARVVDEPASIVVRADSPFATAGTLVAQWRSRPAAFAVGAGSAVGGPDYIFALEVARAAGLDTAALRVLAYDGAGDLLAALLDGSVDVAFAGSGEYLDRIDDGALRMLAVSRTTSGPTQDVPTLTASGIDIEFTNWRGFFAPPGISEQARERLITALSTAHASPEWESALESHGWIDTFTAGDEFTDFLRAEDLRMTRTLTELGIAK
nr:tripartite tricarboxylate transporter substrate binding protein [Rhodococcus sp. (in: high G+C Gram-positive bacteria)]